MEAIKDKPEQGKILSIFFDFLVPVSFRRLVFGGYSTQLNYDVANLHTYTRSLVRNDLPSLLSFLPLSPLFSPLSPLFSPLSPLFLSLSIFWLQKLLFGALTKVTHREERGKKE